MPALKHKSHRFIVLTTVRIEGGAIDFHHFHVLPQDVCDYDRCNVSPSVTPFLYNDHLVSISFFAFSLKDYHRFEIPSVPRFFDLRNPRVLKLWHTKKPQPAIHLDNRYRLMRHEPMLDVDGNETNEIGEDDMIDIKDPPKEGEKDRE
ncbi:uncharacterized protein LOC124428465 [Vespa crabro]|uniref:uncharacterized protein LOC124428465 n=1 Tax=Vespa crabro TaxID=7445 RepID=UPI001F004D14|nr:uncharacterized protein LOC124428465 [Vespa crabro]